MTATVHVFPGPEPHAPAAYAVERFMFDHAGQDPEAALASLLAVTAGRLAALDQERACTVLEHVHAALKRGAAA